MTAARVRAPESGRRSLLRDRLRTGASPGIRGPGADALAGYDATLPEDGRRSLLRDRLRTGASPGIQMLGTAAGYAWQVWLAGIAVVAVASRVALWLAGYPLHHDEALYGYWARLIASGQDPLLLTSWVDKPPLSIYLIAGSFAALGTSELALRAPGMIASLLTLPAVYALARLGYGASTARMATGLLALAPFAILFAPTAFTDPWLALWLIVAAWAALGGRGLAAGIAAGLAVASKQQGVLVVPLVVALLMINHTTGRRSLLRAVASERVRRLGVAILGFALIFGPLTYWDSLRWHNRPSYWDRSLTTYGPLDVTPLADWPGRALEWAQQLGYTFGIPALSWLLLALAAAVGAAAARGIIKHRQPDRTLWLDLVLAGYVTSYLALHVIVTFQPWDRYLLPLVSLLCLLAARGMSLVWQACRKWLGSKIGLALVITLALSYAAWLSVSGRVPVGSHHGAYAGIQHVAAILRAQPDEAVIYHQSLGWHLDFYLFDTPQERRWFDTAEKLASEAARTAQTEPARPQWLVVQAGEEGRLAAWRPALAAHGLTPAEAASVRRPDGGRSFVIFRIVPLPTGGRQ